MKKIITILLVLVSLTVNSQVIDWDNFDCDIADSVYFVEMNKFRDSLGLSTFVYSNVVHDNISLYVTNQMVKEKRAFHPNKKTLVKKYKSSTISEIINILDINVNGNPILLGPYEVGSFRFTKMGGTYRFTTYSQLAKNIIKGLCGSAPHYKIITLEYGNVDKQTVGVGSGSIQLGEDQKIYATFHMSKLFY